MTLPRRALLVAPTAGGGEASLRQLLLEQAPEGWEIADVHAEMAAGRVRKLPGAEGALYAFTDSRLLVPFDGLMALQGRGARFDLVHAHVRSVRLSRFHDPPVLLSASSCLLSVGYAARFSWPPSKALLARLGREDKMMDAVRARHALGDLTGVAALSVWSGRAQQDFVALGAPEEKVTVIPPAVADPGEREPPAHDAFRLLIVGSDFARKGGTVLLDAFDRLRQAVPRAELVLITSAQAAASIPARPGLTVLGPQPRERILQELLPSSDALVLPSLAEGYGIAVLEAMAAGVVPVTSDAYAFPEIVGDRRLIAPRGDARRLAERLIALAQDAPLRRALAKEARGRYLARFTPQKARERWRALYDAVAVGRDVPAWTQ